MSKSSKYIGVYWSGFSWKVQLRDPYTKRVKYIGSFTSEGDAGRAYDYAAIVMYGLETIRNFPKETISKPPISRGEKNKNCKSSQYLGVYWNKNDSVWKVQMRNPYTKRIKYMGSFTSEEDAGRAYDHVATVIYGLETKRNFPDNNNKSSQYLGVFWNKMSWNVYLWDIYSNQLKYIGSFTSEEDAGRAYDYAAVTIYGPDIKLNFPKNDKSGVFWNNSKSVWSASLWDPQAQQNTNLGYYNSKEEAVIAYENADANMVAEIMISMGNNQTLSLKMWEV